MSWKEQIIPSSKSLTQIMKASMGTIKKPHAIDYIISSLQGIDVVGNEMYIFTSGNQAVIKVWWQCLVPTSTTRFTSDVGYRMAKM